MKYYGLTDWFSRSRGCKVLSGVAAFLLLALAPARSQGQTTVIAIHDGNWNSNSTWLGGTPPGVTDTADIGNHILTLNSNFAVGALTWGPGATLTGANGSLTVVGEISINPLAAATAEHLFSGSNATVVTLKSQGLSNLYSPNGVQGGLTDDDTGTARWVNQAGGTFILNNTSSITGNAASIFTNELGGTFKHLASGTSLVQWSFDNSGTVEVAAGTLQFESAVVQNDSANHTLTGGTWIVDNNATLVFLGGPTFTTLGTSAMVVLDGAGSAFDALDSLETNKGTFKLLNGRSFTAAGDFLNDGQVTISGGSHLADVNGTIDPVIFATTTVTGANSTWNNSGNLIVGLDSVAELNVANGGNVTSANAYLGYNSTASGIVSVSDSGSKLSAAGMLVVGNNGQGTLTVANGGNLAVGGNLYLALGAGSLASLSVEGANSTVSTGSAVVGNLGNATLTIADGGTFTVGSGGQLLLASAAGSNATVDIGFGGTLRVGGTDGIAAGAGNYHFNLAGGNIVITGSDLTTSINAELGDSVAVSRIDTNGFNGTWTGNISGDNALAKFGNGTLTLTGNNTFAAGLDVYQGKLVLTGNTASLMHSPLIGTVYVGISPNLAGSLIISSGAQFLSANAYIGLGPLSTGGVGVTDSGSHWDLGSSNLFVGEAGNGALQIANGSNVTSQFVYVGNGTLGNGTLLITGGNSVLDASGAAVRLGVNGNASATISNGGAIRSGIAVLGYNSTASGTAVVTGAGSAWQALSFFVGYSGNGSFSILSGGNVSSSNSVIGYNAGANGTMLVDGAGSVWTPANLDLGVNGTGVLTISNGGVVSVGGFGIGDNAGSNGTMNLNGGTLKIGGTNGILAGAGNYAFNWSGGTLQVKNSDFTTSINATLAGGGGFLDTNGFNATWAGALAGVANFTKNGAGTLTLSGNNTYSGNTTVNAGVLKVGGAGARIQSSGGLVMANGSSAVATLVIANGGNVATGAGDIAGGFSSNGTVVVDGDGSIWSTGNNTIFLGGFGDASMTISNGGAVIARDVQIAGFGSSTVLVTGTNSTLTTTNDINPGFGGAGVLMIANGGVATSGLGIVAFAPNSTGTALVTGAGSAWNYGSHMSLGSSGNGTLTIANGGTASGGTITFASSASGSGTLNLNSGGVLQIGGSNALVAGSGSYAVYWNGGTIQVAGSDFSTALNATLVDGSSSIFDTQGFNGTWSGVLSGNGSLRKSGNGTLTLAANNTFAGLTIVAGGTLALNGTAAKIFNGTGGLSVGSANFTMTNGASASFGTFNFVSSTGGEAGHILVDGAGSSLTLGEIFAVGYLGNGTLTIANGAQLSTNGTVIGVGFSTNTGTALLTGANSTWTSSSFVYVGDSANGTLTVTDNAVMHIGGNLVLAYQASGNATVNLGNQGVLEIGGADAILSGNGAYAFNWAGGTIRVTGGNFSTSINATLVPDATPSIFNTNGFNATWSGVVSGGDSFIKSGAGTLTFGGANTFTGIATISQGNVVVQNVGAGSGLGFATVIVIGGAALEGSGNIGGNATISGLLSPGVGSNKGLLEFDNRLTLNSSATLVMDLDGFIRGVNYDALNIDGNVSFDGTLQVLLDSGFLVYPSNSFDLFHFGGTVSGMFSTLDLPTLPGNFEWDTSELYTTGRLFVVPEPGTYAGILGLGVLGAALWRRRRAAK